MPASIDWKVVDARVQAVAGAHKGLSLSRAFVMVALEALFGVNATEINDAITDGGNDFGIDAVFVDDEGAPTVHLLNCKYREKETTAAQRNFPATEIPKVLNFLTLMLRGGDDDAAQMNQELVEKVRQIRSMVDQGTAVDFVVHLCSNGARLIGGEREFFQEQLRPFKYVSLAEQCLEDMSSLLSRRKPKGKQLMLQASGLILDEKSHAGNLQAIVCSVPADQIVRLVADPSTPTRVNWDIFDENLRGFLGLANEVNDRVYKAATGDDRYKFWYLNNGIAIVCEKYRYQPGRVNPVVTLVDPQVVNGCQTSNVLFEVSRIEPRKIQDIEVMVRIYATDDPSMRREIALANNTQSKIRSRDLMSNDPIQKKIENILSARGIHYSRKQYTGGADPGLISVDPLRLGQIIVTAVLDEPDRAHTRSDEIFSDRYEEIFNERIDFDRVVPLIRVMNSIEAVRLDYRSGDRRKPSLPDGRSMAYSSFHVLFSIVKLAALDRASLVDSSFEHYYTRALDIVGNVLREQPTRSNYEIFRSPRTRRRLLERIGTEQLRLPLA